MELINTFEGGVDENAITDVNSGGLSGDAWTTVNAAGGHAIVYDSARAAHGLLSGRFDLANGAGVGANLIWDYTDRAESWGWIYIYLTSSPPATIRLIGWEGDGLGIARMNLATTRQIQLLDQNFAGAATTVAAVPLDAWYRIGYRLLSSATIGEYEAQIYLGDSLTPITDGTCASDSVRDTGSGVIDRVGYGCNAAWSATAYTFWVDSPNENDEGNTGPFEEEEEEQPATFMPIRRRGV